MSNFTDATEWGEGKANANVARLNRKLMHINTGNKSIRLNDVEVMQVVDLESLAIKDDVVVLLAGECDTYAATRDELDGLNFLEVQLLRKHLDHNIGRFYRHHAMGVDDNHLRLTNRHCTKKESLKTPQKAGKRAKKRWKKPAG